MSLFLSSLPASATEDTVRTRVIKSIPGVDPTSLRSIVHVAKSRCVPDPPHLSELHLTVTNSQMRICKFQRPHLSGTSSGSMGQWARHGWRASRGTLGTEQKYLCHNPSNHGCHNIIVNECQVSLRIFHVSDRLFVVSYLQCVFRIE